MASSAACARFNFTNAILPSDSLLLALNATLSSTLNSTLDGSSPVTALQNLYCAAANAGNINSCFGICGNPDITGIGVRVSNYVQCLTNVLLVWFSPEDSNVASWSGTMLTMAVVIPAIIQKRQGALTIYHATQVLNFATISSLANLVVAPMCTIWRPKEDNLSIEPLIEDVDEDVGFDYMGDDDEQEGERAIKRKMAILQRAPIYKARALLSFALIAQVALQWAWCIYMFTSPSYFQTPCSPITMVMIFLKLWSVQDINHKYFFIFPLWLLFHMGVTIFWGAILVQSSSPDVHPLLSRGGTRAPTPNGSILLEEGSSVLYDRLYKPIARRIRGFPWNEHKRLAVLLSQVLAACTLFGLTVSTEIQATSNCILLGENQSWGFGQVAALLLGIIPIGVLLSAVYTKQQKQQQKQHREKLEQQSRQQAWGDVPSVIVQECSDTQSLRSRTAYSQQEEEDGPVTPDSGHQSMPSISSSIRTSYSAEETRRLLPESASSNFEFGL